jgi:hypothetical protein
MQVALVLYFFALMPLAIYTTLIYSLMPFG